MKRIRGERSASSKRAMRFVRRVPALVLAGAVLLGGGITTHAASLADIFDAQYYADRYPDLKEAFGDNAQALLQHYLTYGIAEGREVGGLLDVRKYRETYADLDAAFGDNWDAYVDHFLTYGIYEGRDSGTAFNALDYADRYSDLKEAFGDDVLALYQHYQIFGKNENREARSEKVVEAERRAAAAKTEAAKGPHTETWVEGDYTVVAEYDSNGRLINESWHIEWNNEDFIVLEKYDYEYDSSGNLIRHKETWGQDGMTVVAEYDSKDNPVKEWWYSGLSGELYSLADYTYNSDGNITSRIERYADGSFLSSELYEYDSAGNMIERTYLGAAGSKNVYHYEYDSAGSVVKRTEAYYKEDGTLSSVYEYDGAGNRTKSINYWEDGSWSESENEYKAGIRVKETLTYHQADNTWYVNVYEYDEAGNRVKRTYTSYYADGQINYMTEEDGDGNPLGSISYYPNGLIRYKDEYDDAGNRTLTFYNEDGKVTDETIYYSAGGYRTTFYDYEYGTWTINEVDSNGTLRLVETHYEDGSIQKIEHDENGDTISWVMIDSEGNVTDMMTK